MYLGNAPVPCHYCGRHTYREKTRAAKTGRPDTLRTRDHVVPQCRGGTETVVCCLRCNQAKDDGDYEMFVEFANAALRGKPHRDAATAGWGFRLWVEAKLFS